MERRTAGHFKRKLKSSKRHISIAKETSKSNVQRDFHHICRCLSIWGRGEEVVTVNWAGSIQRQKEKKPALEEINETLILKMGRNIMIIPNLYFGV